MSVTVDHVFIVCAAGAPEGEALVRAGLREGSRNTHPGQGTANRRFFFRDSYLELLWVADATEAQSELARPTRLWERWVGRGPEICPFGVVLRSTGTPAPPFPTWSYRPPYLPPGQALEVAVGTPLTEPEYFCLGFTRAPDASRREPVDHALPIRALRHLRIGRPVTEPLSSAARAIEAAGLATFHRSPAWLLELVFDGDGDRLVDFRPDLPLALCFR